MPECDRCGDAHATVNEIEWVNERHNLCPACWEWITRWIQRDVDGGP